MSRQRTLLAFTCALLLIASSRSARAEVSWLASATEAAREAEKTGKPILVYIRSASCYYCDLMQKNVWEDPAIAARVASDFVPLKLTQEDNAEAIRALDIKGFPATLVFAADKRFVLRIDGYVEPGQFSAKMEKASVASALSSASTSPRR